MASENQEDLMTLFDDFQSYIVKQNKNFEFLQNTTLLNHEALTFITSLMEKTIDSQQELARLINILHIYGSQYVTTLIDIRSHLHQTEDVIQTLLQGYLPYYFVPLRELQGLLEDITKEVGKLGPFHLTHKDVAFYYHLQDIVYTLVDDKLFIKIRIPLTASTTAFTLYRIHSVPIPLSANQEERTVTEIEKPYLAIIQDKLFYMLLSKSEYQFCTGNHLKRCNQALTMKESSTSNCALALFYDKPKSVAELCTVTLLPKSKYHDSHIVTVSDNSYLISSPDTHWIQICHGKAPVEIAPCKLCIIKLPCACSLKGQTFYIPPTLQHCTKTLTPAINHSLNLAALFHFYHDNKILYNLSAKSFFPDPVTPEIPQIRVISKEFNSVVQQESKTKLSLKQIAHNIRKKRKMFSDKMSKLSNDLGILLQPTVSTALPVISCVNFVLVVLALATTINIYCKMLMLAKAVHALNLLPPSSANAPTEPPVLEFSNTTLFIFFVVILTILLVVHCLRKAQQRCDLTRKMTPHTKISVVFFGDNDYVPIDLTHTGFLAKDLKLHVPFEIVPRVVLSPLRRRVYMKWGSFSLTTDSGYSFKLPKEIIIPLSQMFMAKRVFLNLTEIQIMACTLGEYLEIYKWLLHSPNITCSISK